jgi:hypothetical protein
MSSVTLANQANLSSIFYYYSAVFAVVITALAVVFRHYLVKTIKEENEALVKLIQEMDKRTSRIEYALYNDGKTGLINKVDALIENQQMIKTDVEVMKARHND